MNRRGFFKGMAGFCTGLCSCKLFRRGNLQDFASESVAKDVTLSDFGPDVHITVVRYFWDDEGGGHLGTDVQKNGVWVRNWRVTDGRDTRVPAEESHYAWS